MLSVSRCHKCDKKADAKDGDVLLALNIGLKFMEV